jgi:hypothetical protein
MKRRVLSLLTVFVLVLTLTGCGNSNIINIDDVIKSPDTKVIDFEVIDNNYWGAILVDKNTGVMYYWITASAGGITPIYNSDGTLMLYEE